MVKISIIVLWTAIAFVVCLIGAILSGDSVYSFIDRFTFVGFFNLMALTILSYFDIL